MERSHRYTHSEARTGAGGPWRSATAEISGSSSIVVEARKRDCLTTGEVSLELPGRPAHPRRRIRCEEERQREGIDSGGGWWLTGVEDWQRLVGGSSSSVGEMLKNGVGVIL